MDGWFGDMFTWAGAFFVFGSFWFVIAFASVFSWLIYLTEHEYNFFSGVVLFGLIWIVTSVNGFSILDNPVTALKWAGVYLAIGVIWSFAKWIVFVFSTRRELKGHKEEYIRRFAPALSADGKLAPEDLDDFIKYLNDRRYTPTKSVSSIRIKSRQDIIPAMSDNKRDLTRWAAWWPFSITWTLCNDALRKLINGIVQLFEGAYNRIANSMFDNEI